MTATSHLTPRQLSTLLDLSGWVPLPWSPALEWAALEPLDPADTHYRALIDGGLVILEGGVSRVNDFLDPALGVLAQPDTQVTMAVPDSPPFHICRGGDVVACSFEFTDGGIAVAYPVLPEELVAIVGDIVGSDAPGIGAMGFRARLAAFDMEIVMLLAETSDATVTGLVDRLRSQRWEADGLAVEAALDRLVAAGVITRPEERAGVVTDLAPLFGPGLRFGMNVQRIELLEDQEDLEVLHVYRNGDRMLVCRPEPPVGGRIDLDCWESSPNELAGMIAAMTMTEAQLEAR